MAERATYGQWSFNGGELSPRMQARVDQAVYAVSTAGLLGWIPLLQGPVVAAPGTHFVAKAAGPSRMFPFEYNPTQGYEIEASAFKFRFYTNDARIETAPGVAYEIAHPYTYAELLELDYWQSADVLYLTGGGKAPKKLSRLTATTFALTDLNLTRGPMENGNSDETATVLITPPSAGTVGVACASKAIFGPGDIGRLIEIECDDFNDIVSWAPGTDNLIIGQKVTWGGRVYELTALSDFNGTTPPEHTSGEEWDGIATGLDANGHGPYGAKWKYLYNRFGLARITVLLDVHSVTAEIIDTFPDSLQTTPSWRWALGAFSDTTGWPETVGGWNDCLVLTKGNRGYTSVIDDFEDFARRDKNGDFQRDLSGQFTLPLPHKIVWQAADRFLLLGTQTGEYTIERVQVQTGTPGPPVFEIRLQSSNGSRQAKPIQADGRMLFLQRAGRKLREMGYAISADRYNAPDMTRLADHIGVSGFTEMAWQAEPERLVWTVLGNGNLAAMTYDPEQQVMGWCRRQLGAGLVAKSASRITDPEGRRDQIWLSVQAGAEYWVLRMAKLWEYGDALEDAVMLDAALSYDGVPAQTFSGLDHLEGREVEILADGRVHRALRVVGGEVTLDYQASKVHIGLAYPALFKTLSPEAGQSEGTAQTKLKRVEAVYLMMVETLGLRVRAQECDWLPVDTRTPADLTDEALPLYTGPWELPTIGTYDRLGQIEIERFQPTPATLIAIVPAIEVGER